MAFLNFTLWQYNVVNGVVIREAGLTTLEVEDSNNDGLIDQRELSRYFNINGQGHLLGSNGDADRDAMFTVGTTGSTGGNYTLYSATRIPVPTPARSLGLVQNFPPFKPSVDGVPCFSADTLIETSRGPVRAADLKVGMLVRTMDGGYHEVRWVGQRRLDAAELAECPHLRPIHITAGALGRGVPAQDLVVSPQHRMLVRSAIAQRMFGTTEILVAAKLLTELDGVEILDCAEVTYVHFMCDDHQIVFANGAPTETLLARIEALKAIGEAARAELEEIFPDIMSLSVEPSRTLVNGRMGRKLVSRHIQNGRPLVC